MLKEEFDLFKDSSEEKSIEVDGIFWKYFITGEGPETVVVLTGGGSIAESAFKYVNSLSNAYKVITPTIPKIYKVDDFINGIDKILDNENITKVILLGFSMGGMLSQVFVRKYPERVSKMILFVSMLPSIDYARKYTKYKKAISIVPKGLFKWISKRSLRKQVLKDRGEASQEDVDFWIKFFEWEFDSEKMNKDLLLSTTDVLIDYFSNFTFTSEDLNNWDGKLLLIESDQDKTISPQERNKFKEVYSKAELYVQKGSGHFGAGLLKPEESIQKINSFLNN